MNVEVLSTQVEYRGKAFNVKRDTVRFENQNTATLDIVEHIGAVTILPLDGEGNILFVRQYRHATGKELLELPAGTLHQNEEPLECAKREIREETGFAARQMVKVGEFYLAPGYSTEYMHVFVASELYPDPLPGDTDEFITLQPIPRKLAYQKALAGELQDGKSLAALLLAQSTLEK